MFRVARCFFFILVKLLSSFNGRYLTFILILDHIHVRLDWI